MSGQHDLIPNPKLEDIELELLLDAIQQGHGYNFHDYARASLKRRIKNRVQAEGLKHISELIPGVLHDAAFFDRFLREMSITVTKMFRNPEIFKHIRESLIPKLKTYPRINIWHAGCATGEEVYSMAIILAEEGLLARTRIYATDYNNHALDLAKKAIYPIDSLKEWSKNYQLSGGTGSFSDYYHANFDSVILSSSLKKNITFAHHNLVCDQAFGEMNVILCRNVLIYFEKALQDKVLTMMKTSLVHRGFLVLGDRETIDFTQVSDDFREMFSRSRIYQKN